MRSRSIAELQLRGSSFLQDGARYSDYAASQSSKSCIFFSPNLIRPFTVPKGRARSSVICTCV
jgi:hypothetical protein